MKSTGGANSLSVNTGAGLSEGVLAATRRIRKRMSTLERVIGGRLSDLTPQESLEFYATLSNDLVQSLQTVDAVRKRVKPKP